MHEEGREGRSGEGRKDGSPTCAGAALQTDLASATVSAWGHPGAPRAAWGQQGSSDIVYFSTIYVSLRAGGAMYLDPT